MEHPAAPAVPRLLSDHEWAILQILAEHLKARLQQQFHTRQHDSVTRQQAYERARAQKKHEWERNTADMKIAHEKHMKRELGQLPQKIPESVVRKPKYIAMNMNDVFPGLEEQFKAELTKVNTPFTLIHSTAARAMAAQLCVFHAMHNQAIHARHSDHVHDLMSRDGQHEIQMDYMQDQHEAWLNDLFLQRQLNVPMRERWRSGGNIDDDDDEPGQPSPNWCLARYTLWLDQQEGLHRQEMDAFDLNGPQDQDDEFYESPEPQGEE